MGADQKLNARQIILADDDADDRDLFEEAIASIDPEIGVAMAHDGEELCLMLERNEVHPDVIFLDLNMPRKNGKECLAEIRGNSNWKDIPVIIYSTSLSQRDIDECFQLGATSYILKPNSFEELKNILREFFHKKFVKPQMLFK